MESSSISCDADLDAAVGKRSAAALTKSISFLDEHCEAFLARSPLLALGVHGPRGPRVVTVATPAAADRPDATDEEPGDGWDPTRLSLSGLDVTGMDDGSPAAAFALVPGYGETLRVNGHLGLQPHPHLRVAEAFLHCAKAILRSRLWTDGWNGDSTGDGAPAPGPPDVPSGWDPDLATFLGRSPFALLTSVDAAGRADLSPRGDPPGLFHLLDGGRVAIADRRGNRRTDTLHNLVQDGSIGVLALAPGRAEVVELRGTATIGTDPGLLEALAVQGKRPKVAIVVDVEHADRRAEPAIAAAALWDPARHIAAGELPRASTIWADHVRGHDGTGLVARAARRLVNERVLAAGIAMDYRSNLY